MRLRAIKGLVRFGATTSALAISMTGAAYAQDTVAPQADAAPAPDDVIIVTATLRASDVQDIPLAVTAVSPQALDNQGVADIKTLSSISPSFNIQSSQTETQGTSIKIRGVGTTGNNTGLESSVGVFIDGVYQSRPGVALGDLLDLERLEILRGPQGTLFGRNTSAGALNITTKRPNLNKVEGFANATYGNFNFINLQGGISVPLVEGVAGIRLSGAYRKRDGLLESSTGAESNDRDRFILRGQFLYEPSDALTIRVIGDYAQSKEHCCDAVIIRETELAPDFAFHGLKSDGVADFGPHALRHLNSNADEFVNNTKQWGVSAQVDYTLSDAAKLTYIGGYRHFRAQSDQDSDFVSLNLYRVGQGPGSQLNGLPSIPKNGGPIKTLTQELRLQGSAFNDKLDFLLGGYYSDEKIREIQDMTLGTDYQAAVTAFNFGRAIGPNGLFALTALGNNGVPVNAAGDYAINRFGVDSKNYSFFTHNVLSLTDHIALTVGARYVNETKDGFFDQLAARSNACQAITNGVILGTIPAALRGAALATTCFPFTTSVALTAPAAAGGGLASRLLPLPREFSTKFKDNEITYTGQLSYNTNNGTLVYASLAHGFKSGGFNLDPTSAVGGADPRFKSEKVDSYELGVKTEFADGKIRANLAVFDMELSDFQVLEFTGVQFLTFNVDGARSRGAELELFGRFYPHMTINLAMTYADAKYNSDCDKGLAANPAISTIRRLCGQPLTNAPKFTGVFGVTYDGPLTASGWGLLANFNANYSSRRRTSTVPLDLLSNGTTPPIPFDYQNAYIKMNARIGFSLPGDRYSIEGWVNNISNEVTRGITANTPLRGPAGARSRVGFIEEPRTYGITARAKF